MFKPGDLVLPAPFVNYISPNSGIGMIVEIISYYNNTVWTVPYYKVLFGEKIIEMSRYELMVPHFEEKKLNQFKS